MCHLGTFAQVNQHLVVSRIYDFEIQASINIMEHVEGEGCTGFIQG